MQPLRHCAWLLITVCLSGCAAQTEMSRLRQENSSLAERIRQDEVRVANLEEQNRRLQERVADAEKAVATLHDATQEGVLRR